MIIDGIVIGLLVLFALVGLCKGFIKSVVGFLKGVTGTAIATLLSKPVAIVLTSVKFNELLGSLVGKLGLVSKAITEEAFNALMNGAESITGAEIGTSMKGIVATVIKAFFSSLFTEEMLYTSFAEFTDKFNLACGTILVVALSFIIALIMLNLIIGLLVKIFTNTAEKCRFGAIDRMLGLLFGLLRGLLMIVIIVVAIHIVSFIPAVGTALEGILAGTKFTAALYEHITTFIASVVTKIDFNALISSAIK